MLNRVASYFRLGPRFRMPAVFSCILRTASSVDRTMARGEFYSSTVLQVMEVAWGVRSSRWCVDWIVRLHW